MSYFSVWLPGQRNLGSNTIISYRDTFRLLLTYCKTVRGIKPEKLTVKMLTESLVSEFLQWLEDGRGCCITTRNQRLDGWQKAIRIYPQNSLLRRLCQNMGFYNS